MEQNTDLDNLDTWPRQEVNGKIFAEALAGCQIVGVEPIDYPVTDGLMLYLLDQQNKPLLAEIDTNLSLAQSLDEAQFALRIAWRPQEPAEAAQDGGGTKGPPRRKKP